MLRRGSTVLVLAGVLACTPAVALDTGSGDAWSVPAETVEDDPYAELLPLDDEAEDGTADGTDRKDTAAEVCTRPGSFQDEWIDMVQRGVYFSVCGTAHWFDSLFGSARDFQDSSGTYGRIGMFQYLDDYDGLYTRVRMRARFALPAFEDRLALMIGRGDEQRLIEDRDATVSTPVPSSFRQLVRDESWLVGLGYSRQDAVENGFDFGLGMRVRSPLDPYARTSYRHHFVFGTRTLVRARETLFWRQSRRFGSTTELAVDHILGPGLMTRWDNFGTVAGDTSGVEWGSRASLFQSLGDRRALAYTALIEGETGADVGVQDYGFETRYRQRIHRRWLFLELAASLTWPRETLDERRRMNPGVGIGIEMYFGPVPDRELN